jgi:hypothetical protein
MDQPRPTDHLQPAGKRRPGEQLTKDNIDDDDDEPVGGLCCSRRGETEAAPRARARRTPWGSLHDRCIYA